MKKILTIIVLAALVLTFLGPTVFAAENQFNVNQIVVATTDVTPPTIPTGLAATAVSASQIDLSWVASTDDTAVTLYRIYRDSVFVGTTATTTYSDTGLAADTLYIYTVTAIDAANNESGHSASASARTFQVVVPTAGNTGGSSGSSVLTLKYLNVAPDFTTTVINFGTNAPVQTKVYWGRTADYELGSIASSLYKSDNFVQIADLVPGTHYYFKIDLVDGYGRHLVVGDQEFTTLSLPDVSPPANVTNFVATPKGKEIVLTWKNPQADFEAVRIVRSDKFYPRDPSEGQVIYEGGAEKYVDSDVEYNKTYYYSAFARDRAGNYASGAVTDARLYLAGETPTTPKLFAGILQLPKELVDPLLRSFSILDIDFIQDGKKLPVISDTVDIRGDRDLTISIDYEKVPEILKTIAVTMFDPADHNKTFSFLLRVNKEKTAYQAHIAAFERPGRYEFALAILDYKHQGLASLAGTLVSRVPTLFGEAQKSKFWDGAHMWWLVLSLIALVVLASHILFRRKRNQCAPETVPVKN